MKEIAQTIVREMVDHPDELKVTETMNDGRIHLLIVTHKEDIGKVIGKGGKNIDSLRKILKAICSKKFNKGCIIELKQ